MTNEAPKEIWAFYAPEIEEDSPQCTIVAGDKVMHGSQKYVRADHALAMVAAEREACAETCDCRDREKPDSLYILGAIDANQAAARRIRARTPDDAQAALNALLKAEREAGRVEGLREAAGAIVLIEDSAVTEALEQRLCCDGYHCGCKGALVEDYITHTILTLIEKETGQ